MIRPYRPNDADAVLELNAANVPDVGPMDVDKLGLLLDEALAVDVVELDDTVVGSLFLLREGGTYGSPNYRWFCERHERFAYVDRVMLAEAARGQGWGPRLYERAAECARSTSRPVLVAEVNTIPPNPRSLRFHELFGFVEVARRHPYNSDEQVAMLEHTL